MPKVISQYWVGVGLVIGVAVITIVRWWDRAAVMGSSQAMVATLPVLIKSGTLAIGVFLVWSGWPRTRGRGLHCKRCGYYQEDRGRIVGACPECAYPWRWVGWSRVGARDGRSWKVTVGASLLVLMCAVWMIGSMAPWLLLRWMPTPVLIQRLSTLPDDELMDEWNEFEVRRVPAEQLEGLAQSLLRKRSRDGYLSRIGEETMFVWMRSSPRAAAASTAFLSQLLSGVIRAPDSVEVGDLVSLKAEATFRGGSAAVKANPGFVVCSALYLDDSDTPAQKWVWPVRAAAEDEKKTFSHLVETTRAGPVTARQVFWLTMGASDEVTIGPSGPYAQPGMSIVTQFEVVHTIAVRDPKDKKK